MTKTKKKRETKLKLADIPKVGTAGRDVLVKSLIKLHEYTKAMSDGFHGFSEEELTAIEQKYQVGRWAQLLKHYKNHSWM